MSFGFSAGDFIAVVQLANELRQRLVGAPAQFKAISEDVRHLAIVLQDVEVVVPQREEQKIELAKLVKGCHDVLEEIEVTLAKYQVIDSSGKSFGGKSRRVWKRLQWNQKEIDQFRSRITLNITAFNLFLTKITSNVSLSTKVGVDRLNARQDGRERCERDQAILNWLAPFDYAPQQHDFMSRHQAGTGQWLLDSSDFQAWLDTDKQTLFCPGIPGAGKSIMTAIVVDHLLTKHQNDPNIGIAYLYCNFKRNHEQKLKDLLLNLLRQLARGQALIPDPVDLLYKRNKGIQKRPELDEIKEALHAVIVLYSEAFIVVDALDECQVADGCRATFLSEIFHLQARCGAKVFATSRFIPEITEKFEKTASLEIRASEEDVRRYLDGHIWRLPKCVSKSLDLQEKIKAKIIETVDGMFLLAQLHLDSLIDKTTPRTIARALENLPKGSGALDDAYDEAIRRIQSQEAGFKDLAWGVLLWITCARRPLTSTELQHALAVEADESELGEDNFQDIEEMVSLCAGLVTLTVSEENSIIRLVHYTTQEYFERTRKIWFPNAETDIAKICVTYLSFDAFDSGSCRSKKGLEERLQENALYDYAAQNWGYHARMASTGIEDLVVNFLENEAKLSAASEALLYLTGIPRRQLGSIRMMGVHHAAYFGLYEVMIILLEKGHDPNPAGSGWNRAPLSWAGKNGHEAVVELLLARGGLDVDSRDDLSIRHLYRWRYRNNKTLL